MVAKIIDGKLISRTVRSEIAAGVVRLKAEHNITPGLAVVLVGDDPASAVYVRSKQKAATEAGMYARDVRLKSSVSQRELMGQIDVINNDERIHGVLVQLPLPEHIEKEDLMESLNPLKDVDGLHPSNMGRLVEGRPRFVPATPAGIQELLARSGYDPEGKHVVVCGRSEIVGKPISLLLMQRRKGANATVTVCHTRTVNLPSITSQADILVAAIGRPEFVKADMVKEGVVVVDVGVNRVVDRNSKRGYRLVGDVDFGPVSAVASAITPVPGGVGPMTITMLLDNTLKAARLSVLD